MWVTVFPLADPAAGGLEKRTPPAALPSTGTRRAGRLTGPTCWPQGVGFISACSLGAQETLPGAPGTSNISSSTCPPSACGCFQSERLFNLFWGFSLVFQARNRHNLEQSSKLAQNKELLNKRNAQVTVMDQRIGDLRERLHKKRAEVRQPLILLPLASPLPLPLPPTYPDLLCLRLRFHFLLHFFPIYLLNFSSTSLSSSFSHLLPLPFPSPLPTSPTSYFCCNF